ncbi:MAG: hypothetical protein ABL908_20995, partial [Hyphomicrobium sp.]
LEQYRLYAAGEAALSAIRRLAIVRRRGGALPVLRERPVSGFLEVTNGEAARGLTRETGGSAELGIALALLMHAAQCQTRTVFATGALDRDNDATGALATNVAVRPVAGLSAKIEAVRRSSGAPGAAMAAILFLPRKTIDHQETAAVHAAELDALRTDFAAKGVELAICPVATLEEAVARLGINGLVMDERSRRLVGLGAAAALLGGLALAGHFWLASPIALELSTWPVAGAGDVPTPLRVRYGPDHALVRQSDCRDGDRNRLFGPGDRLVLAVAVRAPGRLALALGGYRFAVVGLSETGVVKEFRDREIRLVHDAGAPRLAIEIAASDGREERTRVVVLARRIVGFDRLQLREDVRGVMDAVPASERLNAGWVHLQRLAPGSLKSDIRTTAMEVTCAH